MKNKRIVSLTIAFAIVAMGCSGLLLYFGLKPQAVTAIHVLFGLLFIGFIIFHIKNNWSSLKTYTRDRKAGPLQKEFYIALGIFALLGLGAASGLPPFGPLVHAGENLTRGGEGGGGRGRFNMAMFTSIGTNAATKGTGLHFVIQKKQNVATPVIVIWAEDSAHQFIQNLFVPGKVLTVPPGEDNIREAIEEGEAKIEPLIPAMLPVWQAKAKDTAANFKESTPNENFFLDTKTIAQHAFNILIEIKNNGTTELYETWVDSSKSNAFVLKAKNNNPTLLEKALVVID